MYTVYYFYIYYTLFIYISVLRYLYFCPLWRSILFDPFVVEASFLLYPGLPLAGNANIRSTPKRNGLTSSPKGLRRFNCRSHRKSTRSVAVTLQEVVLSSIPLAATPDTGERRPQRRRNGKGNGSVRIETAVSVGTGSLLRVGSLRQRWADTDTWHSILQYCAVSKPVSKLHLKFQTFDTLQACAITCQ